MSGHLREGMSLRRDHDHACDNPEGADGYLPRECLPEQHDAERHSEEGRSRRDRGGDRRTENPRPRNPEIGREERPEKSDHDKQR